MNWKEWHERFSESQCVWEKNDKEMISKAQAIVNDFKKRIKEIESKEFTDTSFKQAKKAKDIIDVIVYISERTRTFNECIGNDLDWTLEKETELLQTKIELSRMKQNNAFLLKFTSKLKGRKIYRNPNIEELYGFATREGYARQS